eukprot:TRINITY_DN4370_c0_g1_i1.p1 TRINITY_DN4370_c0_g1~~TRINITY_DN4370_c0_g1_i1.p1  ORF type:complete len:148 (-),score=18.59 TRINITY_DN4370_c0_g1_i1:30-473(-)
MCFFQEEDGIRDLVRSRGLGDVYKRQVSEPPALPGPASSPVVPWPVVLPHHVLWATHPWSRGAVPVPVPSAVVHLKFRARTHPMHLRVEHVVVSMLGPHVLFSVTHVLFSVLCSVVTHVLPAALAWQVPRGALATGGLWVVSLQALP